MGVGVLIGLLIGGAVVTRASTPDVNLSTWSGLSEFDRLVSKFVGRAIGEDPPTHLLRNAYARGFLDGLQIGAIEERKTYLVVRCILNWGQLYDAMAKSADAYSAIYPKSLAGDAMWQGLLRSCSIGP